MEKLVTVSTLLNIYIDTDTEKIKGLIPSFLSTATTPSFPFKRTEH